MTRPTSGRSNPAAGPRRRRVRGGGFTLVEMLVVIGIIVLLIGLLSPMISRAYRNAERVRVAADLNAISTALEAYKQDFGIYIPVPAGTTGANMLARGLIGPGKQIEDGVDGPGFRVTRNPGPDGVLNTADDDLNTKAYPPYLSPDTFKLIDATGATFSSTTSINNVYISDRFKKPILYFVAVGRPNINAASGPPPFIDNIPLGSVPQPLYNFAQNSSLWPGTDGLKSMRIALGDFSSGDFRAEPPADPNGRIDKDEQARFQGPYILWSAGPNELFGPQADDAGPTNRLDHYDADAYDDITNFRS